MVLLRSVTGSSWLSHWRLEGIGASLVGAAHARGRERRRGSAVPGPSPPMSGQLTPYFVHSDAYLPVHSWSLVTNPSATTSLTVGAVIGFGISSTDGTEAPDCGSLMVLVAVVGFWPLASAMASCEAASASPLIAL